MVANNKISNEENLKPVPNPTEGDSKKPVPAPKEKEEIVGGQKVLKTGQVNVIHPIRDFLGKDDNVNFAKNAIDGDVGSKWAYDAFPFQGVVDVGDPPKQIDFIRIASENDGQPVNIDFSNNNTLTGYSGKISETLKKGVNVIKTRKDLVARYIRLEFTGNKELDEDKNQKPDPVGIYYIQIGQGDETKVPVPVPVPRPEPEPNPNPEEPPKPTEGRIKNWGGDITKGAKTWKVIKMKENQKIYKVTDASGTNIADLFNTPESAQAFITYKIWEQGKDAGEGGGGGGDEEPKPEPGPGPAPTEKGLDKNGVKLLVSDGKTITYDYEKDTRPGKDDGIRYNMENVGKWKQSEVTGYFMFTKDPVDDEVSIKWSEMGHSGSNNVQCYDSGVEIKTGKARLRFENPHPIYSGNLGSGQGSPLNDKWIGYKGTKTVGTDGSVTITLYQDTGDNETKPSNQWKQIFQYKDTKYKRNGPHPELTLRVDDPKKQGQKNLREKWISAALIE